MQSLKKLIIFLFSFSNIIACSSTATIYKTDGRKVEAEILKSDKEKINTTDADAVFMKTSNGIKTSYNGQAAVDQEHK